MQYFPRRGKVKESVSLSYNGEPNRRRGGFPNRAFHLLFQTPTFGSYHLTLFLWGFGMDQGKNFLQNLQSVSS
jgi:hypothetical protein